MIAHGNALLSEDLFEKHFVCHLDKCKGACCVKGDRGAPLELKEVEIIQHILPQVLPLLEQNYQDLITQKGFYETDDDGELVTKCLPTGECCFVIYDKGIASCGIEKAFLDKKIDFPKPVSCHLYPIRAAKYGEYTVLNYHKWEICSDACILGEELKVPVYEFVDAALRRKMGSEWTDSLKQVYQEWIKNDHG